MNANTDKKNKFSEFLMLAVLIIAATLLFACSGGNGSGDDDKTDPESETHTVSDEPGKLSGSQLASYDISDGVPQYFAVNGGTYQMILRSEIYGEEGMKYVTGDDPDDMTRLYWTSALDSVNSFGADGDYAAWTQEYDEKLTYRSFDGLRYSNTDFQEYGTGKYQNENLVVHNGSVYYVATDALSITYFKLMQNDIANDQKNEIYSCKTEDEEWSKALCLSGNDLLYAGYDKDQNKCIVKIDLIHDNKIDLIELPEGVDMIEAIAYDDSAESYVICYKGEGTKHAIGTFKEGEAVTDIYEMESRETISESRIYSRNGVMYWVIKDGAGTSADKYRFVRFDSNTGATDEAEKAYTFCVDGQSIFYAQYQDNDMTTASINKVN